MWEDRFVLRLPDALTRGAGTENVKYRALLQHETALEPNAYEFLMAFVKDEEIFWKVRQQRRWRDRQNGGDLLEYK